MSVDLRELYWAAGFLEGEGTFGYKSRPSARVSADQVNREPLDRLAKLFGGCVNGPYLYQRAGNKQPHYRWQIDSTRAVGVLFTLYPLMSRRRQEQITVAVNRWAEMPGLAKDSLGRWCVGSSGRKDVA